MSVLGWTANCRTRTVANESPPSLHRNISICSFFSKAKDASNSPMAPNHSDRRKPGCSRRRWAHIVRDRYDAKDDRSCMLRAGVVCGGASLYAPQPPPSGFPYRTGQLNRNLPHTNVFFLPLALLSPDLS